jgi:hypothetical protein
MQMQEQVKVDKMGFTEFKEYEQNRNLMRAMQVTKARQ